MATGIVTIGVHTLELPEEEARALFIAAGVAAKTSAALVISSDITTVITRGTHVSITIPNGFEDAFDPTHAAQLGRLGMKR